MDMKVTVIVRPATKARGDTHERWWWNVIADLPINAPRRDGFTYTREEATARAAAALEDVFEAVARA